MWTRRWLFLIQCITTLASPGSSAWAQSTADFTWDPDWHRGFYDPIGVCALHLIGRHQEREAEGQWFVGAALNIPLTGCTASSSQSANARPARDAWSENLPAGDGPWDLPAAQTSAQMSEHASAFPPALATTALATESVSAVERGSDVAVAQSVAPALVEPAYLDPAPLDHVPPDAAQVESRRFDPVLMREVVQRALAHSGLETAQSRLQDLVSRSRLSGLLPELRLRGAVGLDQTQSVAAVGAYPGEGTLRGRSDVLGEVRLTFRLNHLLFGDSESGLERVRLQVLQARKKVVDDTLDVFLQWYKFERRRTQRDLAEEERLVAELAALEAAARLDVLTDGWFFSRIHSTPSADASAQPH